MDHPIISLYEFAARQAPIDDSKIGTASVAVKRPAEGGLTRTSSRTRTDNNWSDFYDETLKYTPNWNDLEKLEIISDEHRATLMAILSNASSRINIIEFIKKWTSINLYSISDDKFYATEEDLSRKADGFYYIAFWQYYQLHFWTHFKDYKMPFSDKNEFTSDKLEAGEKSPHVEILERLLDGIDSTLREIQFMDNFRDMVYSGTLTPSDQEYSKNFPQFISDTIRRVHDIQLSPHSAHNADVNFMTRSFSFFAKYISRCHDLESTRAILKSNDAKKNVEELNIYDNAVYIDQKNSMVSDYPRSLYVWWNFIYPEKVFKYAHKKMTLQEFDDAITPYIIQANHIDYVLANDLAMTNRRTWMFTITHILNIMADLPFDTLYKNLFLFYQYRWDLMVRSEVIHASVSEEEFIKKVISGKNFLIDGEKKLDLMSNACYRRNGHTILLALHQLNYKKDDYAIRERYVTTNRRCIKRLETVQWLMDSETQFAELEVASLTFHGEDDIVSDLFSYIEKVFLYHIHNTELVTMVNAMAETRITTSVPHKGRAVRILGRMLHGAAYYYQIVGQRSDYSTFNLEKIAKMFYGLYGHKEILDIDYYSKDVASAQKACLWMALACPKIFTYAVIKNIFKEEIISNYVITSPIFMELEFSKGFIGVNNDSLVSLEVMDKKLYDHLVYMALFAPLTEFEKAVRHDDPTNSSIDQCLTVLKQFIGNFYSISDISSEIINNKINTLNLYIEEYNREFSDKTPLNMITLDINRNLKASAGMARGV